MQYIKKMASRMTQSYKRILDDLNHLLSSLTLIEGNNVEESAELFR